MELKQKREKLNSFLFILFLFLPIIIRPIKYITNWNWIIWPLTLGIIIISILVNEAYRKPKYYFLLIGIGILIAINLLLVDYREEAIIEFIKFGKFSLVILLLGLPKMNYQKIANFWYYLGLITLIIFSFEIKRVNNDEISYMFFGINIVLSNAGIIYRFFQKKKWYDMILVIYSIILVVIFGNRGAVLTVLILDLLILIMKINKKGRIRLFLVGIIMSILYFSNGLFKIVKGINLILIYFGIDSYNMNKIIMQLEKGFIAASSGRDRVTTEALELIINANFLPMGVGYYQSESTMVYPHNILLEFFIIFGFLSLPIIFGTVYYVIKFYKEKNQKIKKDMVTLLMIISITRLIFSDTFVTYTPFWMCVILLYKSQLDKISKKVFNYINKIRKNIIK